MRGTRACITTAALCSVSRRALTRRPLADACSRTVADSLCRLPCMDLRARAGVRAHCRWAREASRLQLRRRREERPRQHDWMQVAAFRLLSCSWFLRRRLTALCTLVFQCVKESAMMDASVCAAPVSTMRDTACSTGPRGQL